jgi:hypothetical protein
MRGSQFGANRRGVVGGGNARRSDGGGQADDEENPACCGRPRVRSSHPGQYIGSLGMTFENWIYVLLAAAAAAAIYLTTPAGRRLADRLDLPTSSRRKQRAPAEDQEYLLQECDNDPHRVGRLIEEARRHNPDMSEADAYRRAIRKVVREKTTKPRKR